MAAPDVLASSGPDARERLRVTQEMLLDWAYGDGSLPLRELYEKGKRGAWNGSALPWQTEVDFERMLADRRDPAGFNAVLRPPRPLRGREAVDLSLEIHTWMLSQFLHGEQGALLVAGRLVEIAPDMEMKLFAASQASDEARHVEVYARYLREKVGAAYPVSPELGTLLRQLLADSRWDVAFLGMQVLVEGLALAAFGLLRAILPEEPLLGEITRRVMADEARHVAFGVVALEPLYRGELTAGELREREEFAVEGIHLLHDRLLMQPVWERLGWERRAWSDWARETPFMRAFRQLLFARIVPSLRRIGLLTPRVRTELARLDLLRFADAPEPEELQPSPPEELVAVLLRLGAESPPG